jgi:hypothetical protein
MRRSKRHFPLADVLTVLSAQTGRSVRRNGRDDKMATGKLCEFVLGRTCRGHGTLEDWTAAKAVILEQCVEFRTIDVPRNADERWIVRMIHTHGATVELAPPDY